MATKGKKASLAKIPSPPTPSAALGMDDEFRAREDAHDMIRHAEIRKDPKRLARAAELLRSAASALSGYEADEGRASKRKPNRKASRGASRA
jgi:hypothetical protein